MRKANIDQKAAPFREEKEGSLPKFTSKHNQENHENHTKLLNPLKLPNTTKNIPNLSNQTLKRATRNHSNLTPQPQVPPENASSGRTWMPSMSPSTSRPSREPSACPGADPKIWVRARATPMAGSQAKWVWVESGSTYVCALFFQAGPKVPRDLSVCPVCLRLETWILVVPFGFPVSSKQTHASGAGRANRVTPKWIPGK